MRDPTPATHSAASATAEPAAAAAPAPGTAAQAPDGSQVLEGKILEVIDVPSYTYLRIEQGNDSVWTAVSSTKVAVGQSVRVRAQTRMENFASSTLKRTFDSIYFGVVDDGSSAEAAALPAPALSGSDPHGAVPGSPHQNAAEPDVPVGKVEKAPGPNGYRVGDVFAQKQALAGKTVQVRGVVVKATNGVMGKNFIHLRDGSGDAKAASNDLTVTLDRAGNPGETVLVEGKVVLDQDIGAGYRYDVLLENAHAR
jgi:hypothetical protein